jgi:hypothetical protein
MNSTDNTIPMAENVPEPAFSSSSSLAPEPLGHMLTVAEYAAWQKMTACRKKLPSWVKGKGYCHCYECQCEEAQSNWEWAREEGQRADEAEDRLAELEEEAEPAAAAPAPKPKASGGAGGPATAAKRKPVKKETDLSEMCSEGETVRVSFGAKAEKANYDGTYTDGKISYTYLGQTATGAPSAFAKIAALQHFGASHEKMAYNGWVKCMVERDGAWVTLDSLRG